MQTRLLRRPRPYPDESLAGYIVRLTEANYYESSRWIFQMAGLRRRQALANIFNPKRDDLSQLSNICDVEESILWSMAFPVVVHNPHITRQGVSAFGEVISTKAVEYYWMKICPFCLQAAPYYRRIWDLSAVTACPIHLCLLFNRCPACGLLIYWERASVVKCQCQFDWRDCQQFNLNK